MNTHKTGRRTGALLLVIAMLLSLSACAKKSEPPKPKYQGTLTLWAAPGLAGYPAGTAAPSAEWYAERARAFESLHPDVKVEVRLFPSPTELESAMLAGLETPDLAFGRFLPQVKDRLANVGEAMGAEAAAGFRTDGFRHEEKLLGLPALLEVQVLALNEQVWADAGLSLPSPDWSRADFESSLQKLAEADRFGLGFYHLPGYHEWYPLASGLFRQDGSTAGEAAAGIARLNEYRRQGWLHPDSAKVKAAETWQRFAEGGFAAMPAAPWQLPLLREAPYNVKLAVAPFPGKTTAGHVYGVSLFRQEDPLKLTASLELAQFLTAPDQMVRLARETGLMPARKSDPNPFEGDAAMSQAYQTLGSHTALPTGPGWEQAEPQFAQALLYALLGAKEPSAALDEAQQLLTKATTQAK